MFKLTLTEQEKLGLIEAIEFKSLQIDLVYGEKTAKRFENHLLLCIETGSYSKVDLIDIQNIVYLSLDQNEEFKAFEHGYTFESILTEINCRLNSYCTLNCSEFEESNNLSWELGSPRTMTPTEEHTAKEAAAVFFYQGEFK